MNVPFSIPRPSMERLGISRLGLARGGRHREESDDREPLSPRPIDIEAQTAPEMAERSHPARFLNRIPRPTMPSFLSNAASSRRRADSAAAQPPELRPRPSSSHYSGDAEGEEDAESPKTPRFTLTMPNMPSTRLHLPNLTRTWTQGSNGPPSRPGTAHGRPSLSRSRSGNTERFPVSVAGATEPMPSAAGADVRPPPEARARTRFRGVDPAELRLAELVDDGRQRRHRREGSDRSHRRQGSDRSHRRQGSDRSHRSRGSNGRERDGGSDGRSRRRRDRDPGPPPKHFLFCFPWIRSRRVRSLILRCFVAGMFLALLLTIYLSLTITKNITNSEFSVLLILIILFVAIFFCHGLIRLCVLLVRGPQPEDEESMRSRRRGGPLPQMLGPGGYAIPRRPIRVVLARDEEAAGIESEATKANPPAYGLWRESVRVDPNRIYWMKNEEAPATVAEDSSEEAGSSSSSGGGGSTSRSSSSSSHDDDDQPRPRAGRPPSYMSDDGVNYVVEARPRSMAPGTDVPLAPHPAEIGRIGRPSEW